MKRRIRKRNKKGEEEKRKKGREKEEGKGRMEDRGGIEGIRRNEEEERGIRK